MILLYAGYVLYLAALPAICLFALLRGGRTERAATTTVLIGVVATQVVHFLVLGNGWRGPEYGIMAVDVAVLLAFVAIAHRSERFWPIWMAAAQLVSMITHLAVVVHPNLVTELYQMIQPFWVFPILGFILWGTFTHRRATASS